MPQFIVSVAVFTQPAAPHAVVPAAEHPQTPEIQDSPVAHVLPQPPQFVVDIVGSTQPLPQRI